MLKIGGDIIKQDVLIVLSKRDHPELMCAVLAHHGISAAQAKDIRNAIHNLESRTSAFLVLDLDLEGADLFLDTIVSTYYDPPPFLMAVDAFSDSAARADILDRGADVCLEKPVDAAEILAVINAALRRAERSERRPFRLAPCIVHKDLTIDPLRRTVTMAGQPVDLTLKEFEILHLLATYPGIVFSKAQIYKHVWNADYEFATTSVSDQISSIRQKLGINAKDKQYIQTIYGVGYRFAVD